MAIAFTHPEHPEPIEWSISDAPVGPEREYLADPHGINAAWERYGTNIAFLGLIERRIKASQSSTTSRGSGRASTSGSKSGSGSGASTNSRPPDTRKGYNPDGTSSGTKSTSGTGSTSTGSSSTKPKASTTSGGSDLPGYGVGRTSSKSSSGSSGKKTGTGSTSTGSSSTKPRTSTTSGGSDLPGYGVGRTSSKSSSGSSGKKTGTGSGASVNTRPPDTRQGYNPDGTSSRSTPSNTKTRSRSSTGSSGSTTQKATPAQKKAIDDYFAGRISMSQLFKQLDNDQKSPSSSSTSSTNARPPDTRRGKNPRPSTTRSGRSPAKPPFTVRGVRATSQTMRGSDIPGYGVATRTPAQSPRATLKTQTGVGYTMSMGPRVTVTQVPQPTARDPIYDGPQGAKDADFDDAGDYSTGGVANQKWRRWLKGQPHSIQRAAATDPQAAIRLAQDQASGGSLGDTAQGRTSKAYDNFVKSRGGSVGDAADQKWLQDQHPVVQTVAKTNFPAALALSRHLKPGGAYADTAQAAAMKSYQDRRDQYDAQVKAQGGAYGDMTQAAAIQDWKSRQAPEVQRLVDQGRVADAVALSRNLQPGGAYGDTGQAASILAWDRYTRSQGASLGDAAQGRQNQLSPMAQAYDHFFSQGMTQNQADVAASKLGLFDRPGYDPITKAEWERWKAKQGHNFGDTRGTPIEDRHQGGIPTPYNEGDLYGRLFDFAQVGSMPLFIVPGVGVVAGTARGLYTAGRGLATGGRTLLTGPGLSQLSIQGATAALNPAAVRGATGTGGRFVLGQARQIGPNFAVEFGFDTGADVISNVATNKLIDQGILDPEKYQKVDTWDLEHVRNIKTAGSEAFFDAKLRRFVPIKQPTTWKGRAIEGAATGGGVDAAVSILDPAYEFEPIRTLAATGTGAIFGAVLPPIIRKTWDPAWDAAARRLGSLRGGTGGPTGPASTPTPPFNPNTGPTIRPSASQYSVYVPGQGWVTPNFGPSPTSSLLVPTPVAPGPSSRLIVPPQATPPTISAPPALQTGTTTPTTSTSGTQVTPRINPPVNTGQPSGTPTNPQANQPLTFWQVAQSLSGTSDGGGTISPREQWIRNARKYLGPDGRPRTPPGTPPGGFQVQPGATWDPNLLGPVRNPPNPLFQNRGAKSPTPDQSPASSGRADPLTKPETGTGPGRADPLAKPDAATDAGRADALARPEPATGPGRADPLARPEPATGPGRADPLARVEPQSTRGIDIGGGKTGITGDTGKIDIRSGKTGITGDTGKIDIGGAKTGITGDTGKIDIGGAKTGITGDTGKIDIGGGKTGITPPPETGQLFIAPPPGGKTGTGTTPGGGRTDPPPGGDLKIDIGGPPADPIADPPIDPTGGPTDGSGTSGTSGTPGGSKTDPTPSPGAKFDGGKTRPRIGPSPTPSMGIEIPSDFPFPLYMPGSAAGRFRRGGPGTAIWPAEIEFDHASEWDGRGKGYSLDAGNLKITRWSEEPHGFSPGQHDVDGVTLHVGDQGRLLDITVNENALMADMAKGQPSESVHRTKLDLNTRQAVRTAVQGPSRSYKTATSSRASRTPASRNKQPILRG